MKIPTLIKQSLRTPTWCISFSTFLTLLLCPFASYAQDDVMLQGFYWDVPVDSEHRNGFWYDTLASKMEVLREAGFTEIWLPPPSKGNWGIFDNGYGVHDHYDLGAYEQIGTRETRFGSAKELENLILIAHDTSLGPRINLLADVLLNHLYSTQLKDYEVNPALKDYILNEAVVNGKQYHPYPLNEIVWELAPADISTLSFELKCYCPGNDEWNGAFTLEVDTGLQSLLTNPRSESIELKPGNTITPPHTCQSWFEATSRTFPFSIRPVAGKRLYIRISARKKNGNSYDWTDQTRGISLETVPASPEEGSLQINVLTPTGIHYVDKEQLPNLNWNYSFFHPAYTGDFLSANLVDDQVTPALKWFGHDFNHNQPELTGRMADWGRWLRDSIGFDGYRLDFVMGVDKNFAADWINRVWQGKEQHATLVAEYFSQNKQRIREWADLMEEKCPGVQVSLFDFPLKFELNDLCHDNPGDYDMRRLLEAGMLFDPEYHLPADRLVSFVDNHDTGKESDKWMTQNWEIAYSYIFFHPAEPCVFYNHFFGVAEKDFSHEGTELEIPGDLGKQIRKLIKIRQQYLSGNMVHLTDKSAEYRNLYVAFREGAASCMGAFLTLTNGATGKDIPPIKLKREFSNFFGKELINLIHPEQTIRVGPAGQLSFDLKGHREGIWILKEEVMD
ncbi:MAG: hypothetical protein JW801_18345 [Bacteroidales bacterium]|nr:hypothetical protein [Bacteroidales bacterium]